MLFALAFFWPRGLRGCDEEVLIGDRLRCEDTGDVPVEEEGPPRLCTGTYSAEEVVESDLSDSAGEAARRGMAIGLDMSECGN